MSPRPNDQATAHAGRPVGTKNGPLRPASPELSPPFPHAPEKLYHYVVVRSDLPRGFLASQIVHASGESVSGQVPEGTHAVVLAVTGIRGLLEIRRALEDAEIPHRLIVEPDPPWNGAPTALGLAPTADRRKIRKILGRLPLLK